MQRFNVRIRLIRLLFTFGKRFGFVPLNALKPLFKFVMLKT